MIKLCYDITINDEVFFVSIKDRNAYYIEIEYAWFKDPNSFQPGQLLNEEEKDLYGINGINMMLKRRPGIGMSALKAHYIIKREIIDE